MKKSFMEWFKKKVIKGLLVGVGIIVLMLFAELFTDMSPFRQLEWYIIPVVMVVCLLYGTGWVFAFNLIKRSWRKMLRVDREASLWQALTGRGLWIGLLYGMLCFVGGCVLAMFVGNYFMIKDFSCVKQGRAPMSEKYKFDSDMEYNTWLSTVRNAVEYSDAANNASAEQRLNNDLNLRAVENGYIGRVTTDVKDGDKTVKKETTIY